MTDAAPAPGGQDRAVESVITAEAFASAYCSRGVNPGAWQVMHDKIVERDAQIRAAERAPLLERIAELEQARRWAEDRVDLANEGVAEQSKEVYRLALQRDAAVARAQRAEEALRQIATTTVGGGGDRIAQQLRDIAHAAYVAAHADSGGRDDALR